MSPTRPTACALVAALLVSSSGCTALGVGLGSAIPRCPPPQTGPVDLRTVPLGTEVQIDYVADVAPPGEGQRIARVEGSYRGIDATHVYVESDPLSYGVPLSKLREARPIEGRRTWALEGLYVGLALDVAFFTFIGLASGLGRPGW